MSWIKALVGSKNELTLAFFWNLLGPCFILATFAFEPKHPELALIGIFGLFLCARFEFKGVIISSLLLLSFGSYLHFFTKDPRHLWFLGIEVSFLISFIITALSVEQHNGMFSSLMSQIQMRGTSLLNLEEEFSKVQMQFTKQQVILQEKIDCLQKLLDDSSSEQSSLTVLNEVLRKTTSKHIQEAHRLQDMVAFLEVALSQARNEKKDIELEMDRLVDSKGLMEENRKLIDEINRVRLDKEQTHTINETVARLYAKEYQKNQTQEEVVSTLEMKNSSLKEEICFFEEEVASLKEQLQKNLEDKNQHDVALNLNQELSQKVQDLEHLLVKATDEKNLVLTTLKQLQDEPKIDLDKYVLKTQLVQLEESLAKASEKLQQLQQVPEIDLSKFVPKDEVDLLQEKISQGTHVANLYKQLKDQFDEKNEMLHLARRDFFVAENQLQSLSIEQNENELSLMSDYQKIFAVVTQLEEELKDLYLENELLTGIVSSLNLSSSSSSSEQTKRKKVKIVAHQESLF